MKYIKTILLPFCAVLAFVGCGDNSTSSGNSSSNTVLTGSFIDAPVQGLYYKTVTQEGYTDYDGTYKYIDGETIEFKLGTLSLGSVLASENITPYIIAGDKDTSNPSPKSTNIARLLQSLDKDSSNDDVISIPNLANVTLPDIDLSSENADLISFINTINTKLSTSYSLKTKQEALNKMNSYLYASIYGGYAENLNGDSIYLKVFYNSTSPFISVENTSDISTLSAATITNNVLISGDYNCTKSKYELVCNDFNLKPLSINTVEDLSLLNGSYNTVDDLNNIWTMTISSGDINITNNVDSCSLLGKVSVIDQTTLPMFTLTATSCDINGLFYGYSHIDSLYKDNDTLNLMIPNFVQISKNWTK